MKELYECGTCGVVAKMPEQLCDAQERDTIDDYCGTSGPHEAMCDCIKEQLSYVCGSCGRPAEQPDLVCQPLITG